MKRDGITLVELLIALLIFGTIFALSSQAIISGVRGHQQTEAVAAVQSKLRRVTEVVGQQLRGAVFGSLVTSPYTPDSQGLSFILLDGAGGYPVLPHDSGNNNSFSNAANVQIIANVTNASELGLQHERALMINANGDAVSFLVGNVTRNGNGFRVRVVHPGCPNTIAYTQNTLLFKANSVGIRYDPESQTIFRTSSQGITVPLAFDISDFQIDYVYVDVLNSSEVVAVLDAPVMVNGIPQQQVTIGGTDARLARLQLTLEAEQQTTSGVVTRSYTSQVEIVNTTDNRIRSIQGVTVCD